MPARTQKKTADMVERKVIFLTESGFPPTPGTMSQYLDLFVDRFGLSSGQSMRQIATGGPTWNQADLLAKTIDENPLILRIAVLDDSECRLVGPELFSAFKEAIREDPSKSSWQIAMGLVGSET